MKEELRYIADDGSEWETPEEAKERDAIHAFNLWSSDYRIFGIADGCSIYGEDIVEFILEHMHAIKEHIAAIERARNKVAEKK